MEEYSNDFGYWEKFKCYLINHPANVNSRKTMKDISWIGIHTYLLMII